MRRLLLATPLPDALAAEARAVVELLRGDGPRAEKAERAFRFIYAVGEEALEYHFVQPLRRLGVGTLTRGAVEVALGVALKGLRPPLHHVLHGLDETQLRAVADEVEVRLYPDPHGG
jgi:hypothetical protein